jgi:CO/xanthine dehydrogenase Mo-binding subunit
MNTNTISPRELGKPMTRVDGRLKVTGTARYAAEFGNSNVLFAFAVKSTIGKGRIASIMLPSPSQPRAYASCSRIATR